MKIETGYYRIDFYDSKGSRISGNSLAASGFLDATERGRINLGGDKVSFTIDRRIYNSLDSREKYSV
jgi:hypothetical protein